MMQKEIGVFRKFLQGCTDDTLLRLKSVPLQMGTHIHPKMNLNIHQMHEGRFLLGCFL